MVSESSSSDDDAERNPKPDPNSIDQSLDAIENQLASISMSQSVSEPDSESESDHGVKDETKELRNGSFNEIEQLRFHSSFSGEVSGVGEEVVEVKVEGQDEDEDEDEEEEQEQEVDVPEASSSRVWRNASEVEDVEAPSSPSSSGYAGERGSTSSTSGIEEINDNGSGIHEVENDGEFDAVSDSQTPWVPGKRQGDEVSPLFVIFIYYII